MPIRVLVTTGAQAQSGAPKTVSTPSLAFDGTGCNAILIGIAAAIDSGTPTLVDTNSNTYTLIGSNNHTGVQAIYLYACFNPVVSMNMVFTYTTTITTFPTIGVMGLTGLLNITVDQTSGSNPGTTNPPNPNSPGSITPSQNNEIWVSLAMDVAGIGGTGITCVPGTIAYSATTISAVAYGIGMSYAIQTTASAVNPVWTFPAGNEILCAIWSLEALPSFLDFQEIVIRDRRKVVNY